VLKGVGGCTGGVSKAGGCTGGGSAGILVIVTGFPPPPAIPSPESKAEKSGKYLPFSSQQAL